VGVIEDFLLFSDFFGKVLFPSFVACVASVLVRGERNSGHAKARAKKEKEGGGGGERRERLPANPLILKNAH